MQGGIAHVVGGITFENGNAAVSKDFGSFGSFGFFDFLDLLVFEDVVVSRLEDVLVDKSCRLLIEDNVLL